jgi:hypothetical protein
LKCLRDPLMDDFACFYGKTVKYVVDRKASH